jgi:hypothetical protein
VLNKPEMAGRAFFYIHDPALARAKGADFLSDAPTSGCLLPVPPGGVEPAQPRRDAITFERRLRRTVV